MHVPTFPGFVVRFVALLALVLLGPVHAQVIERIDVVAAGDEAEIRIHFNETVQYTRHFPLADSDFYRVFFRLGGRPEGNVSGVARETYTPPTNGLAPSVLITYPEEGGTIGVRFQTSVRLRVRTGADARSISLYVPRAATDGGARPQPTPEAAPAQAPPPRSPRETEEQAVRLLAQAREALGRNNPLRAKPGSRGSRTRAGAEAMARGDRAGALEKWERLATLVDADSDLGRQTANGVAQARQAAADDPAARKNADRPPADSARRR